MKLDPLTAGHPSLQPQRGMGPDVCAPAGLTPAGTHLNGISAVDFTSVVTVLVLMLLFANGCKSVVDPGPPMRQTPIPQQPSVIPPAGPEFPEMPSLPAIPTAPVNSTTGLPNTGTPTGVEHRPASAVLKLPVADPGAATYHTVKSGETWSSIALDYRLAVGELTEANGMDHSTLLQPGQMIYIPR